MSKKKFYSVEKLEPVGSLQWYIEGTKQQHTNSCINSWNLLRAHAPFIWIALHRVGRLWSIVYPDHELLWNSFILFSNTGLVSGSTEVNKIYSIDLYDTTTDYQDIRISDELINSQLMWPDMTMSNGDDSEDQGKYVKHKVPWLRVIY